MLAKTTLTAVSVAVALGLVAGGQSAVAQTAETISVSVNYGDLNLSTEAGSKEMLQRIHAAARLICGTEPSAPLDRMTQYAPCVKRATDRAVARLNNSTVASLAHSRNIAELLASVL
jgi:UrcA family protein